MALLLIKLKRGFLFCFVLLFLNALVLFYFIILKFGSGYLDEYFSFCLKFLSSGDGFMILFGFCELKMRA